MTRAQLLGLGFGPDAIKHRLARGTLFSVQRGVYVVGRPWLTRHGQWMAAILSCGAAAVLSHMTAATLWGILDWPEQAIHVSVPATVGRRRPGIIVHRRAWLSDDERTHHDGVPATTPVSTLVDLAAAGLALGQLEAAVKKADALDLLDPETLRDALGRLGRRPGLARLRRLLDRRTFRLTDSELERRFLPIARRAGLPRPLTGRYVNGFKVDFWWPDLGLVVETDGLRYHRTPAQQATDRLRDQAHVAAGTTALRFTHEQVAFDPRHVEAILRRVVRRLRRPGDG